MGHTLRWFGHSGCEIVTGGGKRLMIDPWLSHNPVTPVAIDDLEPTDYVLITHDHGDHASDLVAVCGKTGATLIGQPEVVKKYQKAAREQGKQMDAIGMNIGGTVRLDGVNVTMTDAYHSSETGMPTGYLVTLEDGKVVHHLGDTGLHINMSTWGELFDIDLALVPIGDHFTMDGRQAAHALKWLKAKQAIPIHYKTFPLLAQSADKLVQHVKELGLEVEIHVLDPGGVHQF